MENKVTKGVSSGKEIELDLSKVTVNNFPLNKKIVVTVFVLTVIVFGIYKSTTIGLYSFFASAVPLTTKETTASKDASISGIVSKKNPFDPVYIEGFDFSKLQSIGSPKNEEYLKLAKDRDHIYYLDIFGDVFLLPESDSSSFEKLSDSLYKDKKYIYYYSDDSLDVVSNADVATFHILNSSFAADKNNLFVTLTLCAIEDCSTSLKRIPEVDIPSLTLFTYKSLLPGTTTAYVEDAFLKDKNYAYFLQNPGRYNRTGIYNDSFFIKKTRDLDLPTLTEVTKNDDFLILKDKNGVYTYDATADFTSDDDGNISSNPNLVLIKGADSASFIALQQSGSSLLNSSLHSLYLKDKNSVYYAYSTYDYDSRDVFSVQSISHADPTTFTNLGNGFAKDKNNVWFQGKVMAEADSSTFIVDAPYDVYKRGYNASDANSLYSGPSTVGDVIVYKNADKETFTSFAGGTYAKDKNHVWYYGGVLIPEADSASFVYDDHEEAHDKNHTYNQGKLTQ